MGQILFVLYLVAETLMRVPLRRLLQVLRLVPPMFLIIGNVAVYQ